VMGAECDLRSMYSKFKRLTLGVQRDLEHARANENQLKKEHNQQIEVEVEVSAALQLGKRKKKEYKILVAAEERRRQDQINIENIMLMFDAQKRAADAARAQDKAYPQLAEYISQILLKYYIPTIEMLVK
jgi:hypothetical protein